MARHGCAWAWPGHRSRPDRQGRVRAAAGGWVDVVRTQVPPATFDLEQLLVPERDVLDRQAASVPAQPALTWRIKLRVAGVAGHIHTRIGIPVGHYVEPTRGGVPPTGRILVCVRNSS